VFLRTGCRQGLRFDPATCRLRTARNLSVVRPTYPSFRLDSPSFGRLVRRSDSTFGAVIRRDPCPWTARVAVAGVMPLVHGGARSGGARDQTPTVKISPQQSVAPCPLVIQEWEAELRGFEHREKVISWISEGARLGFSGPRSAVQSPPSFLNEQDYKIIMTDIKSEVAAGRILGPFSPDNLATSYHSRTCEYRQSE